ncbi:MAG: phosphotransferase [Pseudomonadales bacterium]|jgi:Ser/Thr protein kinase RdoA (MazF antagonist)|nr:phosphotransferase [Pseudomonadales bacterium]MDP7314096.1 phosphotransferase [Pseudomonadales bacterium]MDP7451333.1 phosphotransferase [Arenicellales bacterium]MDP7577164.1 phosphotransferase [Pseudomonadales bacterium]HJP50181.1 phosphotransferase [Pseudomonadales bacterium]|tara:strand:+ start:44 stop:1006 length:963 start_codon:yes stop_codon:yes gene_type:complete
MDDPKSILAEVKPCLTEWNIEPIDISLASHSENIVYKVTSHDDKTYALRVHRPGYHSLAELNSEQIWTDALMESGLQVPRAYPTSKGEFYVATECGGCERQVGLVGWLEGHPLGSVTPKGKADFFLEKLREIGVICARFHNQAANWMPPPGFSRHRLNHEGFVGENPFWGRFWEVASLRTSERRTIDKLRTTVSRRLLDYGEQPQTYSMIHADLHEGNFLVGNNGLTVIDFDDAGFGWHIYDLAVALFSHTDRSDYDGIQNALIEGYRTERDITDEDLSLLPLFILIRALALMGWIHLRPEVKLGRYLSYLTDKACSTTL